MAHSYNQHPAIATKLSQLRAQSTSPKEFRALVKDLSTLLCYEALRNVNVEQISIDTPLAPAQTGFRIKDNIAFVPILRAGLGMVDGALELFPEASVYHIGMYRDKRSLQPVEYYNKLPSENSVDLCVVLDPMLATGGTAIATIELLKAWGAKKIKLVGLVAAKDGVASLLEAHPDVEIHVCAVDEVLDSRGYIVPGLGDAGDRQFSTPH
jgi:uracil phosphoribosyltransferase